MFDEILDISVLYTFLEIVLHLMASVKAQMTHSGAHFNDQIILFSQKKLFTWNWEIRLFYALLLI